MKFVDFSLSATNIINYYKWASVSLHLKPDSFVCWIEKKETIFQVLYAITHAINALASSSYHRIITTTHHHFVLESRNDINRIFVGGIRLQAKWILYISVVIRNYDELVFQSTWTTITMQLLTIHFLLYSLFLFPCLCFFFSFTKTL